MRIRRMEIGDFEEVVDMYYNFCKEVFGAKRKIAPKYFYYQMVTDWINSGKDIIIAYDKDCKTYGFSMCYKDVFNYLTEPVYTCEVAYVKPEYRNTRAAYMLFKNGYSYAKEQGLNIVVSGRVSNGVDKIIDKHFNLDKQTISFEGVNNE